MLNNAEIKGIKVFHSETSRISFKKRTIRLDEILTPEIKNLFILKPMKGSGNYESCNNK